MAILLIWADVSLPCRKLPKVWVKIQPNLIAKSLRGLVRATDISSCKWEWNLCFSFNVTTIAMCRRPNATCCAFGLGERGGAFATRPHRTAVTVLQRISGFPHCVRDQLAYFLRNRPLSAIQLLSPHPPFPVYLHFTEKLGKFIWNKLEKLVTWQRTAKGRQPLWLPVWISQFGCKKRSWEGTVLEIGCLCKWCRGWRNHSQTTSYNRLAKRAVTSDMFRNVGF